MKNGVLKAHEIIRKMATELVQSMGGEIDLLIDVGYPSVSNNEVLNELARNKAAEEFYSVLIM